jgi:hypothetical protein
MSTSKDIKYRINGGKVSSIIANVKQKALIVNLHAFTKGTLNIWLPREVK